MSQSSSTTRHKVSVAIQACQLGACVAAAIYLAYQDGVANGKASVESVKDDLPADDTGTDSPPKSTSLDGE